MSRGARNPDISTLLAIAGVAALAVIVLSAAVVTGSPNAEAALPRGFALNPATPTTTTTTTQAPADDVAAATPESTTTTTQAPVEEVVAASGPTATGVNVNPTGVRIVSIGVDASMIDLYKKADNTLQVPEDIHLTGWYTGRSVPGEPGPSIVVGHVDSAALGAGVFYRLRELVVGDLIEIDRSDGSVARFRVTDSEIVLKSEFPTEKVYGSVEGSKLRLITCGGAFDGSARSYLGNVIVYAEHLGNHQPVLPRSWDLTS